MRRRNWRKYNQNLVKRGSLTFFIDIKALDSQPPKGFRGRPRLYANPLIQMLLILKIQYRMPYRMLEGFSKNILPYLRKNLALPSYSIICRRAAELKETLPRLSSRRPQVILLDASGIKVYGEGEWKVKIHGKAKRRKWIKIHIAIDECSQEIVAMQITNGHTADCIAGSKLIDECPKTASVYKADGGYDTHKIRSKIKNRGARALIPPRKNAKPKCGSGERNRSISEMRGLGLDPLGRSLWGKLTGYSKRALVETSFSRLKRIYGGRFFSQGMDKQRVEGHLKCYMMNKMRKATI